MLGATSSASFKTPHCSQILSLFPLAWAIAIIMLTLMYRPVSVVILRDTVQMPAAGSPNRFPVKLYQAAISARGMHTQRHYPGVCLHSQRMASWMYADISSLPIARHSWPCSFHPVTSAFSRASWIIGNMLRNSCDLSVGLALRTAGMELHRTRL